MLALSKGVFQFLVVCHCTRKRWKHKWDSWPELVKGIFHIHTIECHAQYMNWGSMTGRASCCLGTGWVSVCRWWAILSVHLWDFFLFSFIFFISISSCCSSCFRFFVCFAVFFVFFFFKTLFQLLSSSYLTHKLFFFMILFAISPAGGCMRLDQDTTTPSKSWKRHQLSVHLSSPHIFRESACHKGVGNN